MKRKLLICVCALTLVASITDRIYACCDKPVADFSAPTYICIDCVVSFDASGSYDPDGTQLSYDWNFGSGAYDVDVSDPVHPTCKYSTAGAKTVILEVTDNDDPDCCGGQPNCGDKKSDPNAVETVTVVRVDKVVENVSPFTNEGPLDTCIDESVGLLAIPYPAGASFPADEPHWSFESWPSGAGAILSPAYGSTTTLSNIDKAGNYVIKAQCGDSDDGDTITVIADGWEADPVITGAAIKKSHDQEWFHISQSCDLKAKGYDADTKCDTEYDDYIRLDLTEWSGSPYLTSTLGEHVTWEPTEPTSESGHTITASIKDDPDFPDGSNTDDGDASASRVLKAYEAAADLTVNWANSGGSGNVTTTLFESTGPTYDSVSKNMNDSESVSVNATTLSENESDTDSSFFEPQEPFVKGKWTLKLNPSSAPLDAPGKIKVTTDVDVSGTFECNVDDNDWDLCGCDVSVGVSAGVGPVSVSISPDLDTAGDVAEGQAAISWGYSSDLGLSRESPNSEELEKSSGDGTGAFEETFSYAPFSQDHVGEKGETAEGLAKVGGKIEAKGTHEYGCGGMQPCWHNYYSASASMACTGSTVTYYIMDPTVQNPAYWPPESGYYD